MLGPPIVEFEQVNPLAAAIGLQNIERVYSGHQIPGIDNVRFKTPRRVRVQEVALKKFDGLPFEESVEAVHGCFSRLPIKKLNDLVLSC
jgi:hypothetical protein